MSNLSEDIVKRLLVTTEDNMVEAVSTMESYYVGCMAMWLVMDATDTQDKEIYRSIVAMARKPLDDLKKTLEDVKGSPVEVPILHKTLAKHIAKVCKKESK